MHMTVLIMAVTAIIRKVTLNFFSDNSSTLKLAVDTINKVLKTVSTEQHSVILITDGTSSISFLTQASDNEGSGTVA